MPLRVLHTPLESATTICSQQTQRELGLPPMFGGVPSHDEEHLASCEPTPAGVFTLPVQLRWRQPSQGHPDRALQTSPLFTKRGGRRGSRGEFPIAISLHHGATERPEQVLFGVPEHMRDDGHETIRLRGWRAPIQRRLIEPIQSLDELPDRTARATRMKLCLPNARLGIGVESTVYTFPPTRARIRSMPDGEVVLATGTPERPDADVA
jgi:hypothetical protein